MEVHELWNMECCVIHTRQVKTNQASQRKDFYEARRCPITKPICEATVSNYSTYLWS
jgi:hypothetical protein